MFLKDLYIKISDSYYEKKYIKENLDCQKKMMKECSELPENEYEDFLVKLYKERMACELDFSNPITYTQKIQWIKLYGDSEKNSIYVDKYLVKKIIENEIGNQYVNELICIDGKDCFYNADEIDFSKLPERFVMKCNHGSGYNIIVNNKSALSSRKIKKYKKQLNTWLQEQFAFKNGLELVYKNVKPCIFIEKYLQDDSGELRDYKLFCMDGKVTYIEVDESRYSNHKQAFYSPEWEKLNFDEGTQSFDKEKPDNLSNMIQLAEKLAAPHPFVRIDLYCCNNQLYFGEYTFYDASGFYAFNPPSFDKYFGDMIHLDLSKRENNYRYRKQ